MFRYGLVALAVVAVIVVGTIMAVPYLVSSQAMRADLARQIEDAAGYRVEFGGDFSLQGIPALTFAATDISLWAGDKAAVVDRVTAESIRFQLDLLSLFGGRVRFDEITLVRPDLVVAAAAKDDGSASVSASPDEPAPLNLDRLLDRLERLEVKRFRIERGRVAFAGSADGAETIDVDVLDVALPSISSEVVIDAVLRRDGQTVDLAATIDSPRRLLEEQPTVLKAVFSAPGIIESETEFSATVQLGRTSAMLENLAISGEAIQLGGSLAADWSGSVPRLTGDLGGERIVLPALAETGRSDAASRPADDNGAVLDLSGLGAADVNLSLSLDRVAYGDVALAPLVGKVRTSGGYLDVTADLVGLAGGSIRGNVSVDPSGGENETRGTIEADGIDLAVLQPMVDLPFSAQGVFGASLNFATLGRSAQEMRDRANAAGQVHLSRAAVSNTGLAALIGDPAADTFEAIGLVAEFDSLTAPVAVRGGATWRGERFDVVSTVDAGALIAGAAASVDAAVKSSRVSLGYDGTVISDGRVRGAVSLDTPSLRGLLAWINRPLAPGPGLERFALSGALAVEPGAVALTDANLTVDGTKGSGAGRVVLGPIPEVEATLALETLDLNPYMHAGDTATSGDGGATGGSAGWSTDRLDLSALKTVDARLVLSTQTLIYKKIKTGPVALNVALNGGRLAASLDQLALYGGEGLGRVVADASGAVPSLQLQFDLINLDALPFLTDLAGFGRIEGRAALAVDVTTAGGSQRDMAAAMNGQASVRFSNGSIRGINLARMMRSLSIETLVGWQASPQQSTDFSELSASFSIADGIARNADLSLIGPLVRVSGAGTVDLPQQTLDFRVDPKLVASLQGQGATGEEAGFGVPIRVTGPWARPNIYPDVAGILQNPEAAYQQLRGLGGGIFDALGGGDGAADPAAAVGAAVERATGVNVGDIVQDGQIDRDAAVGAAVDGIGRLLGVQPAQEAAAPAPAQQDAQGDAGEPISLDPNAQPPDAPAPIAQPQQPPAGGLNEAAQGVLRGLFGNN